MFDDLTALTRLGLNGNDLTTLPADVFEPLAFLTGLNLSNTGLTTLPAGVFDNQIRLHKNLTITYCPWAGRAIFTEQRADHICPLPPTYSTI